MAKLKIIHQILKYIDILKTLRIYISIVNIKIHSQYQNTQSISKYTVNIKIKWRISE